ncbi:MAG: hypothetical protein JSV53_02960 [candidate division WOR-3 bacterium]|nr:MAG: hypothetical protein JSV53_02960 [candidate division WOR-3 bacterium]
MNWLVILVLLNGAFERHAYSARATALGHAFTASCYGVDAVRFNPAALSLTGRNYLSVGYERTFSGIEGLHNITLGYTRPLFFGGVGIQLSEFGFSEQKEQALSLAYGLGFNESFKFGVGGDLYIIDNSRTGRSYAYGLNVGLLGKLYKKWSLGVYGHNINGPQFGSDEWGELPAELKAGLAYEPFDGVLSEIDFSIRDDDMRVHLAAEFELFGLLFLRSGVKTSPLVIAGGVGIVHRFISFDYAAEYIPELPLSHTVTIGFIF